MSEMKPAFISLFCSPNFALRSVAIERIVVERVTVDRVTVDRFADDRVRVVAIVYRYQC
ncbi:MAG: hypothetical protein WBN82_04685 [Porticoccaceae bacterium]